MKLRKVNSQTKSNTREDYKQWAKTFAAAANRDQFNAEDYNAALRKTLINPLDSAKSKNSKHQ